MDQPARTTAPLHAIGWPAVRVRVKRLVLIAIAGVLTAGCGGADAPVTRGAPAGVATEAAAEEKASGTTADVYRFAKISNGAYFYTGSAWERDQILASYPDFRYEGVAFQQLSNTPGAPVFRFANLANGGYFYTASVEERDFVRGTRPDMRFEGTSFSVVTPASPGGIAVYRLANLSNGAYLYTAIAVERDFAIGLGTWRPEGIAFYVPASNGVLNCPNDSLFSQGSCICNVRGYLYDPANNTCALPSLPDFPIQLTSGWAGEFVDGGGSGGDGSSGGDGGAGAGGGSSLGILKKAKVEVYYPKDGALFLAASGETDSVKGMITIKRGSYTGPALVVFKGQAGASYFDEAVGPEVPFPAGREMNVMLPSLNLNFGASPLTEAAFQYALQIYGDPRLSRGQNLVRILTPQRIQVSHDLVRTQINAMLPPNIQVTDIARLPYMIGPTTRAGEVPNTPNGLYAMVLSSFAFAAKNYNSALVGAAIPGAARTPAPASLFMQQLALDLIDGRLDTFSGNLPVAETAQRMYTLSVTELIALKLPTSLTLPATLAVGLQTSLSAYGSSALTQSIGTIIVPPPPVAPTPPSTSPSCTGTLYPLAQGGQGCCAPGFSVVSSGSYFYCTSTFYYLSFGSTGSLPTQPSLR